MKTKKYKVWKCFICVPEDAKLPEGFDWPPRQAAKQAILDAGVGVCHVFSGWGDTLPEGYQEVIDMIWNHMK